MGAAEIDGDHLVHMEAHIVIAEFLMHQAGVNMLSRMVLHEIKTPLPVNSSMHPASHVQRLVGIMDHYTLFPVYIKHPGIAQGPLVPRLSAAFGIKSGVVQYHLIAFLPLRAAHYYTVKVLHVGIFIKKFIHFIHHSFLLIWVYHATDSPEFPVVF